MPPHISFDPHDFAAKFERQPFLLKHGLSSHPLFALEALVAASQRLPSEDIELNAGDVDIVQVADKKPEHRLTPEETIAHIETLNTWLGLKKVSQLAEYSALIDEVLDTLKPHIDPHCPGMHNREGFIFITSPNSTVPYHMDPEHNFLLQIHGEKIFTIFDKADRELLPEEDIEHHYGQANRKMVLHNGHEARGRKIHLKPGDALHVPINAPHYVQNSDNVSISISITYDTPSSLQREMVYRVNRNLRKLGITPRPYAASAVVDRAKIATYRLYHFLRYAPAGLSSNRHN